MSIVSQETYLFVGSIYDNIAYARPDASRGEVVSAAKIAGAHDFIMKLPDAYQTRVGHGYMELSGGERQRVSIARAVSYTHLVKKFLETGNRLHADLPICFNRSLTGSAVKFLLI